MPSQTSPSHRDGTTQATRRTWRQRLRHLAGAVLGLGLATTGAPAAQAQSTVPQHWISYASLASNQFQAWLSDPENEAVRRLHDHLQARMLANPNQEPPAPVIVRVWVDADGRVYRVEFPSLGNAKSDADLREILTAQPLSEPPPRDMRQPMVLRLRLDLAA